MTSEPTLEPDFVPAEPQHFSECIGQIGAALARDGALGVILIDGGGLERIERSYGVQAHRKATDMLRTLVREACRQDLGEHDLVVGGSASPPSSAPARPPPDGASAETPFDLGYAAAQATLRRLTKMCRRTPTEGTRERRARVDRKGSQRAAPRTNSTQRRRANATRTQKEPPRNNSTQRRRANATRTQ